MTIVYRSVKGSNLTPTEVDNNFHDVDNRIVALEGVTGKTIESIDITGNVMTITYTDATTDVFTLSMPTLVDAWQGAWQPLTPYLEGQLVTANGSVWLVLQDHTSGSPDFDPNATLGTAGNLYQLFLATPSVQVFTRSTTTFTPEAADANSYNRCTNVSGCTVTIPDFADVPFPVNTELHFRQCGAGGLVFDASSAVLINGVDGFSNSTVTQGAVVTFKNVDTDEWDLFGRLEQPTA